MITLAQFFNGRDIQYADELTPEMLGDAATVVLRANKLLAIYTETTGDRRPRGVTSGWRPAAINANTPRAAKRSKHMICRAVDVSDASKSLKKWLMTEAGQKALIECELWMEHPDATPSWVHLQIVPPGSGRRVFTP